MDDWEVISQAYDEEVKRAGLSTFSEHHLLEFFEQLWKTTTQQPSDEERRRLEEIAEQKEQQRQQLCFQFMAALQNGAVDSKLSEASRLLQQASEVLEGGVTELLSVRYGRKRLTPLHIAVEADHFEAVKLLLSKGADVNAKDASGWTPLHVACFNANLKICEYLVTKGNAAVLAISSDGTLPLHYLVRHQVRREDQGQLVKVVRLLLDKGAVNVQTALGESLLHYACLRGCVPVVECLLDAGANPNLTNARGETCLHTAARCGCKDVVELLLARGADPNVVGEMGTAKEAAERAGHKDLTALLAACTSASLATARRLPPPPPADESSAPRRRNTQSRTPSPRHPDPAVAVPSGPAPNGCGPSNTPLDEPPQRRRQRSLTTTGLPRSASEDDSTASTSDTDSDDCTPELRRAYSTMSSPSASPRSSSGWSGLDDQRQARHGHCRRASLEEASWTSEPVDWRSPPATSVTLPSGQQYRARYFQSLNLLAQPAAAGLQSSAELLTEPLTEPVSAGSGYRAASTAHVFRLVHFGGPTWCKYCGGFIWTPLGKQGYVCGACGFTVHKRCKKEAVFASTCMARQCMRVASAPHPTVDIANAAATSPTSSSSPRSRANTSPIPPIPVAHCNGTTSVVDKPQECGDTAADNDDPKLAFTPDELDVVYKQFETIDLNKDGVLSADEFSVSLGTIMNEELGRVFFAAFDSNGDGKVELDEYLQGLRHMLKGTPEEQLWFAFGMMDTDHDGMLTYDELLRVVAAIHQSLQRIELHLSSTPVAFIRKLFPHLGGQTNRISFGEYKDAMLRNVRYVQSLGLLENGPQLCSTVVGGHCSLDAFRSGVSSITLGNESWGLVQNMLLGIRRAVSEISIVPSRDLVPQDYQTMVEMKLFAPPFVYPWIFRDYAPMAFRKIRESFGVDAKDYMFSLGPEKILGNLLLGNLAALCTVVSTGRSGSFFFKSTDSRFFVKTLPTVEDTKFKTILEQYVCYVQENPNTLLTRYFGLHDIRRGWNGDSMHFVVMANLFDSELAIDEQYDLKGSTVDRRVQPAKINPNVAMKDLDFEDNGRRLNLGPERKALLLEQVEKDSRFLEQLNICDYSFLVGFHFVKPGSPLPPRPPPKDGSLFKQDYGGMLSTDGKEVYFVGIIDTLCEYNFKKRSEHMLKSIIHDSTKISAIPPGPYKMRFTKHIAKIVL